MTRDPARNAADVLIYNIMLAFIRVCVYIYSGDSTARIHPRRPVREEKGWGEMCRNGHIWRTGLGPVDGRGVARFIKMSSKSITVGVNVSRETADKKNKEEKKSGACLLSLPLQQTFLDHAFYTRCPIFHNMNII